MTKPEDKSENPITPMSVLKGKSPSKLSRGNSPNFSEARADSFWQVTEQFSAEITEKLHEKFAQQRQKLMAKQAQKLKEYNRQEYFHDKGKAPQRPGFWGNKIHKIVDHLPFDFLSIVNDT